MLAILTSRDQHLRSSPQRQLWRRGAVSLNDTFYCPGFKIVEDRRIRCHKAGGHGSETFVQGCKNSCNPVFMEVGARLGVGGMFRGMRQLGILSKPTSTFRERHQRSCISKKCGERWNLLRCLLDSRFSYRRSDC